MDSTETGTSQRGAVAAFTRPSLHSALWAVAALAVALLLYQSAQSLYDSREVRKFTLRWCVSLRAAARDIRSNARRFRDREHFRAATCCQRGSDFALPIHARQQGCHAPQGRLGVQQRLFSGRGVNLTDIQQSLEEARQRVTAASSELRGLHTVIAQQQTVLRQQQQILADQQAHFNKQQIALVR